MSASIPFFGDIFCNDTGTFEGSCLEGNLSVSGLNVDDNILEVEMDLQSAIKTNQLSRKGTQIIIGVDLEITMENGTALPISLISDLHQRQETTNLTVGIFIDSGFKIIQYRLIPIELINISDTYRKNLNFDPTSLENIPLFQECVECSTKVNALMDRDKLAVMSPKEKAKLKELKDSISEIRESFTLDCFNLLQDLNRKNWWIQVRQFVEKIEVTREKIEAIKGVLSHFHVHNEGKEMFLDNLRANGINYINSVEEFEEVISEENVLCLFFSEELVKRNPNRFRDNCLLLKKLREENQMSKKQEFIAVDLDVISKNEIAIPIPKKTTIYYFSNSKVKSLDFQEDFEKRQLFSIAKCNKKRGDENAPKSKGKFVMPCPNSFKGKCERKCREWLCGECQTYFDFGFNNCVYCNCADGKGTAIDKFEFMCNDINHGFDYVKYDGRCSEYFEQIEPMENISIIILGQSGVGKSTWINGIVNYMQYEDIEVAKQSKVITAIPTKFTITDQSYESKTIQIGDDENEETNIVGASGTQDCRTYTIRYKDYNVQLIDTPGLGDSRGIEQDKKNVKKILDHIRYHEELHGICILLKPNESKIGILMKFCIKEILTHLHKSCTNNIVYCFTNARQTFYRPGDTLPVLKKMLQEIQVSMPLNRNTIYCFDNEAYRYLCTFNAKGIKYSFQDEKSFGESWDKSVEETKRLLDYVTTLKPHRTQETLTLNQTRRMILSLTRPIADITHNIEMNIQIVNDHKKLIENMDEKDRNLLKELYVPQVTLENVPLGYPRTVCTADRCVEYHVLPNSELQITEYVQHCHVHCYLQGVTPEQYPNPDLKNCAAMSGSPGGEWCAACSCAWSTHMHILYDQKRTEIRVKNQRVQANIGSKENLRKEKERAIKDSEEQVAKLEEEKKKIIQIAGKFAYFLKKHAITPYNDCFCDYLDYLIDHEEGKRYKTDKGRAILESLRKTKGNYETEIEFLETAMANSPDTGDYDPADVKKWEEELYQLPIHGKQLRDNMRVVLDAEDTAARYNQKNLTAAKGFSVKHALGTVMKKMKNLNPFGSKNKGGRQKDYDDDDDDYVYDDDYEHRRPNQRSSYYSGSNDYDRSHHYNQNQNYNYNHNRNQNQNQNYNYNRNRNQNNNRSYNQNNKKFYDDDNDDDDYGRANWQARQGRGRGGSGNYKTNYKKKNYDYEY